MQIQGNMNNVRYRNEIIDPHVLPLVRGMRGQVTFQQDNAPPHRARATIAHLQANNIRVITLENLWDHLEKAVRNRPDPPRDPAAMLQALTAAWTALDQVTIKKRSSEVWASSNPVGGALWSSEILASSAPIGGVLWSSEMWDSSAPIGGGVWSLEV